MHPLEESYPDGPCNKFSITAEEVENGNWKISCAEWHCELYTRTPAKTAMLLIAEIDDHNEQFKPRKKASKYEIFENPSLEIRKPAYAYLKRKGCSK